MSENEVITRRVLVTITKEVEIQIPEKFVNKESLKDWESGLWELEGESHKEKVNSIIKYAARLAADNGGGTAWDGIGQLEPSYVTSAKADVRYSIIYEDIDSEMMEVNQ